MTEHTILAVSIGANLVLAVLALALAWIAR